MDLVDNCLKNIQRLLFPPLCLLCDASPPMAMVGRGLTRMDLCAACAVDLPYIEVACAACALPLPADLHMDLGKERLCGRCLQQRSAFDAALAVFHYQDPIAGLIMGLKFNGRLSHARLLGQLMVEWIGSHEIEQPELLLPVPLHRRRLRERGFNQSTELARHIGRGLGLPVWVDGCRRRRDTVSQSTLPARERRRNVRDVFVSQRPLQGRHVAIIDDVMTTGSTASELSRVLRRAGARRVDLWVCARVLV